MDTISSSQSFFQRNRISIKGLLIGFLILLMLIPTVFVNSLVYERKMRQREIVEEVSSKWSSSQTIAGPYLYIPYTVVVKKDGKDELEEQHFWLLPESLTVTSNIDYNIRKRSIYNVLLYTANVKQLGNFIIKTPVGVDADKILWNEAQLCFGISDFRGIEEKIVVNMGGKEYELSPGLPPMALSEKGLSAPVQLSAVDLNNSISFGMHVKAKGSESIRFIPLAGNSAYTISSAWPNPSFDGSKLPDYRNVADSGFSAQWKFNKANLPYSTVLKELNPAVRDINFGVSLLQPADQYAKTERCVKYAILFVGLTFGLFFITEITQKKPVHPLQYVLIGLALVIFYTLLLSISEFIHFDIAYGISAIAVITMITLYAKQLFRDRRASLITGAIMFLQYLFNFVLIRLEDSALLVGSIGLFIVLGLIMYVSRNIDWYGVKNKVDVDYE